MSWNGSQWRERQGERENKQGRDCWVRGTGWRGGGGRKGEGRELVKWYLKWIKEESREKGKCDRSESRDKGAEDKLGGHWGQGSRIVGHPCSSAGRRSRPASSSHEHCRDRETHRERQRDTCLYTYTCVKSQLWTHCFQPFVSSTVATLIGWNYHPIGVPSHSLQV